MTTTLVLRPVPSHEPPERPAVAEEQRHHGAYLDAVCPVCDNRGLELYPALHGQHGQPMAICRRCGHLFEC